ncbi:MAG: hypothetical protein AAFY76_11065, partial [Cyanobacteria bacterium J06649_11]
MSYKFYFVVKGISETLRNTLSNQHLSSLPEVSECFSFHKSQNKSLSRGIDWDWMIQSFLYMKQAGLDVELVDKPVTDSICIVHYDTTKNRGCWAPDSFLIGIRSDHPPMRLCDMLIVQNPTNLETDKTFLINFWPQAHIIPRSPDRGNCIEKVSYFGGEGNLSPDFHSAEFQSGLNALGVSLNLCF